MKIVSTSYSKTDKYSSPDEWLKRISFYTGILEELAKHHKVYSIERINYEGTCKQNGVDYHFILLKKRVERFPWRMHHLIKELKPDVVLVNGFIFPLQIIQLRLFLGKKVKIIVWHRSEKPFNGIKKWLQLLADKCVNVYFFVSSEFGKQWVANCNISKENKIKEVIHGSSSFKEEDKLAARNRLSIEGNPVYLWVGRLEKNKDPLTVVKSFIQFQKNHPPAKLYIIFQTEELLEEIKMLINNANASATVQLIGKTEHGALQSWYGGADFIISGSHYEGGGIAVIEAMSCGCIPLVTDIISFRKIAGNCGFLYKAGNENALLNVLQHSLKINIEEQQKKVLEEFNSDFSFPAIAEKINHILDEIDK
jgi:glycosyltransferase involved in cell wall biosynthesis